MNKKRLISSIVEIFIGATLIAASIFGIVDEFWSGMGTSLLLIGILFLIRAIKYNTNDGYREKWDIEVNDERNKYLKFKLAGREDLMMMASGSVCYVMILFWISHTFLKKKY